MNRNKHLPRRPVAIDLFAGAGGMSLGFEQAGFDVVAAVEYDPIHCAVHKYNFPHCEIVCKSVADLSGIELMAAAGTGNKPQIDVIFGGPPCQGFSMIGKRMLDDPRNGLVSHFLRIVLECKPKYFVFENVRGLIVGKQKKIIEELIVEFENSGYRVLKPIQVLNAAHFGVPQNRERVFIIGARQDVRSPEYPFPTTCPDLEKPNFFDLPPTPTVMEALGDLPDAENYKDLVHQDFVEIEYGMPSAYASKLRFLNADPENFSYPRIYNSNILTSSLRTDHTLESRRRFEITPFGQAESISRFFKLDPNGISNTLRAGTASDRGAFTSPRPIHPIYHRCVTVREAARLHSYPDWFRFHKTKWHGARQIGNSVPPFLARAVAKCIMKAIGHEPYRPEFSLELGDERLLSFNMNEASSYFNVPKDRIPQRNRTSLKTIQRFL